MNEHLRDRLNQRRIAAQCGPLVELLNELYSTTDLPPLNATEREIGAWIGQRELVRRLNILREEAEKAERGETILTRR